MAKRHIEEILIFICAIGFFISSMFDVEKKSKDIPLDLFPIDSRKLDEDINESAEIAVPIGDHVLPLKIKEASFLNKEEMEYYHKNTWNPLKTLEQNRRALVDKFMKTCVDCVEYFLAMSDGVVLKISSHAGGIHLKSAKIENFRQYDISQIIYLMTDSPLFCRLVRSLITKYKISRYIPSKAVFLLTHGEASHVSYTGLEHVINLRIMNQKILSALDCKKYKMLFGATVFHEMLHWYHQVSDFREYERRGRSMSCILRRLHNYRSNIFLGWRPDEIAKYFSNDEEYYTMYGLREEYGELVLDNLCEANYTYERHGYIRASHLMFRRKFPDERDFIVNYRDSSLLKFFQNNVLPRFGDAEFKVKEEKATPKP